jgi:hypothetical protein
MADDEIDDSADTAADYSAPDPVLLALELCRIASSPKTTATAIKRLRRLGRDIDAAEQKLAAVQAEAAGILEAAQAEVKTIHDEAQRRLDAAATAENELVEREQKIARLEAAWRLLGEPQDVLSGFRSPEATPLAKARRAHGFPPARDPDILGFSEPDAVPAMPIDALSDTHDDPHADRQGTPFLGELTRDVLHKRGAA